MPWEGDADIQINASKPFELALRIPGYAADFLITVNDKVACGHEENGYFILTVNPDDHVHVSFTMKAEFYCANPRVTEDCSKVCIVRGPLVYCAEEVDNGQLLQDFRLNPALSASVEPSELFGGIRTIRIQGTRSTLDENAPLYMPLNQDKRTSAELTLIPYYLWNNRGEGEMTVWLNSTGG